MTNPIPTISVVIPARNEQELLPSCLCAIEQSAAFAQISIEKMVVLNRCTDATEQIALSHGCKVVREDEKNLAVIRNAGVRASTAPFVVTVDADSRMSPGMLAAVARQLGDPRVLGGGTVIIPERLSLGILLTGCLLLPFIVWERLSGGLFWFRREAFEAIGGFDPDWLTVEDIDFARRLKRHAKGINCEFRTLWREHIVTSCRKFDRLGDWYFLRNPRELLRIFKGTDRNAADKIWYEYTR